MKHLLAGFLRGLGFSEHFIWLLLREMRQLEVRTLAICRVRQRIAIGRTRKMSGLKVNLGCGRYSYSGWIGIDSSFQSKADWYLDLRTGLPLADQSCSHLFCEHFMEHLVYPKEVQHFLSECYRVLQNGGVLRLIVPDADKFMRAYASGDDLFFRETSPDADTPIEALNLIFHGVPLGEHHYAYDFDTIMRLLQAVGFQQIVLSECGKGGAASALDRTDTSRCLESLYVEAVR